MWFYPFPVLICAAKRANFKLTALNALSGVFWWSRRSVWTTQKGLVLQITMGQTDQWEMATVSRPGYVEIQFPMILMKALQVLKTSIHEVLHQQQQDFWTRPCPSCLESCVSRTHLVRQLNITREIMTFQWLPGYLSPFPEPEKPAVLLREGNVHLGIKATTSLGHSSHPAQLLTDHDTETTALAFSGQSWVWDVQ